MLRSQGNGQEMVRTVTRPYRLGVLNGDGKFTKFFLTEIFLDNFIESFMQDLLS